MRDRRLIRWKGLNHNVPFVFQDPQFTDLDQEFLGSLGYTVLQDPLAFGKVSHGSLVYAIHCYIEVYKSVSARPRPTMLVGTDVGNFGQFDMSVPFLGNAFLSANIRLDQEVRIQPSGVWKRWCRIAKK